MSYYYLIFVWIMIFGFLGLFIQMERIEKVGGKTVRRMQPLWAAVLVAPLVWWTANRGYVGDSGMYMRMFYDMPTGIREMLKYVDNIGKDEGFYLTAGLIKRFLTKDVKVYFFIIGAVQAILLFRVYRKHSTRYLASFFLFIASTDFISWMFNGMRQFTAVSITLLAFDYILDKKYIRAILIILFASLFHQSALLLIPFVFIVQGRAWNKRTLMFLLATLLIVAYVERFTDILDGMLQETQYKNVVSDWKEWENDGTNILRVLIYAIPAILSLIGLKYIKIENDTVINVCTNMSIVSAGFYIIAMFTSGIFMGRLPIYFSLYGYILLPWEIDNMFEAKSARLVYGAMIAGYAVFYLLQVRMVWGLA